MRAGWKLGAAAVLMVAAGVAAQRGAEPAVADNSVVRALDDTATGNRWLLQRDLAHPAGPGQLVLIDRGARSKAADRDTGKKSPVMVIHAGDRIVVEEKTAVADGWLEAVALGSAGAGGALTVRLAAGGRVLRAFAVQPGRARLEVQQ